MGSNQSNEKSSKNSSPAETPEKDLEQKPSTPESKPLSPAGDSDVTPVKNAATPEAKKPDVTVPEVEVSAEDLARIEAATQAKEAKEGGLRYEVVLSPAVKKGPRISPPTSPLSSQELQKKHKEAEERRLQREALRQENLATQLAKIELAQQKRDEKAAEKAAKVLETLEAKLSTAEENRTAQLKEVKEKLGEHMDKIEKAQKELEMQIEAAKAAAEASLNEKMESYKKKRDEEMEEMLKKIQEHQDHIVKVRANQEEKLKPYVVELENSIKQKLDKAKQAKEKQEEMLMEKLAEHTRHSEIVRQNKEKLLAESNQTTESA